MKKIALIAALVCMTACAFAAKTKVKRVDADKVVDLNGYWNDSDVRIVCETLINDCIESPRIAKFERYIP